MYKEVTNNFCGVINLLDIENDIFDSHFSINENLVTIIPLTKEAQNKVYELSYNDGSNEKDNWIYGYAEDNCATVILQKTHLRMGFSSTRNLSAAKFFSPLIIKASNSNITDVKTFDTIEFFGGIMDKLLPPSLAIDNNVSNGLIRYTDSDSYTSQYDIELKGISFRMLYTIEVPTIFETGKVPDLRNDIHSVLKFEFKLPQSLDTLQDYYSYAMNLFQFCTGRQNVHTEIRLYKKQFNDPIFVKLIDRFSDYADDVIDFTQVIRLRFLNKQFTNLFKLLNVETEQPYLIFLPSKNENVNKVFYTDVNDLCVAFEREFTMLENIQLEDKKQAARKLTEELLEKINSTGYPEDVKEKARIILNSQLKAFSPSLKDKILYFYDKYRNELKSITEIKGHDELGIIEVFTYKDCNSCSNCKKRKDCKDFRIMINKFIDIRNKASHAGIHWNGGEKIFNHLKILIYYSVLERAGFPIDEITCMLSWLYGWQF